MRKISKLISTAGKKEEYNNIYLGLVGFTLVLQ